MLIISGTWRVHDVLDFSLAGLQIKFPMRYEPQLACPDSYCNFEPVWGDWEYEDNGDVTGVVFPNRELWTQEELDQLRARAQRRADELEPLIDGGDDDGRLDA
jgi:hypothetical protein